MFAPLTDIVRSEARRTVPAYVSLPRYLGALAVIFFCLQVVTGILLMIYYRPSIAAAHYSTGMISDEVHLGWLIRSLHRSGSDLLIFLVLVHLIRVYFSRAYSRPRQLIWGSGLLLLLIIVAFDLTGMLLPWDQYAYWSTDFLKQTLASIPLAGNVVVTLLWGGAEMGEGALLRFYAFHIAVLPWVVLLFISLHLLMVWRVGLKQPENGSATSQASPLLFFPDFLVDLLIAFLLALGIVISLAILFPSRLGEPADPLATMLRVQPRWYLMPIDQLLQIVPSAAAVVGGLGLLLLLFCLPLIDRRPSQPAGRRSLRLVLGLLVIVAWVLLGAKGFFS